MTPQDFELLTDTIAAIIKEQMPVPDDSLGKRMDALEAALKSSLGTIEMLTNDLIKSNALIEGLTESLDNVAKSNIDECSDLSVALSGERAEREALAKRVDNHTVAITDIKTWQGDRAEHDAHLDKRFEGILTMIQKVSKAEGPAGKDAEPVDYKQINRDVVTDVLAKLPDLIPAPIKGDKGDPADEEAIKGHLVERLEAYVDKTLPRLIPDPIKGDKGDTPDVNIDEIEDKVLSRVKAHIPEPQAPLAPTELQVLEAVRTIWPDIKQVVSKHLPKMEHKGVWEPGTQYDIGDEVIKNGSTYRKMYENDNPPPGDGWQMIAQGKAGKQGKPGVTPKVDEIIAALMSDPEIVKRLKGKDGVSVKDIVLEDGTMMVIELTNGHVSHFDLTEFRESIIKALGE